MSGIMQKEIILSKLDSQRLRERISLTKTTKESYALLNEISKAVIVEPQEIPADVVTMNSIVQFQYSKKAWEMQIVYPEDADIQKNKVSIFAPIAAALIGYKKGDVVDWSVPGGSIQLEILNIIYQPEAAGDFHL
ncbi:nucleoside diphosphate kinase regulator [Rhodocytophaga rosea]|uniref:Nucleoside diphosphate kinase regulator n=1 Tax=Rhodocytophaga rosea TaxID=2704465 RepID=A0A6C0GGZ8_9BACT|nr:nucleoside diphosphate kinase regulator [Rhodocytophaga rosea]QHT67237.1 nucleoside diphosphate kinase regulator [Rhodocytophaga rosea]